MYYKLFSFLLLTHVSHLYAFQAQDCVVGNYQAKIERVGSLFGLLDYKYVMTKKRCVINLEFKDYWNIDWQVDICREPIHLKQTKWGKINVIKKEKLCDGAADEFCLAWDEFKKVLENEGLIFAEGERDSLETTHGQLYCMYLLIKKYVDHENIFSMLEPNQFDLFFQVQEKKVSGKNAIPVPSNVSGDPAQKVLEKSGQVLNTNDKAHDQTKDEKSNMEF